MTLTEFIKQLKEDYKLQKTVSQIEGIVKKHAKAAAVSGVAVIDDDTVKDWIINADNEKEEEPVVQTVKTAEEYDKKIKEKYGKKPEPKPEPKKEEPKEKKEYEQTSLFDLL